MTMNNIADNLYKFVQTNNIESVVTIGPYEGIFGKSLHRGVVENDVEKKYGRQMFVKVSDLQSNKLKFQIIQMDGVDLNLDAFRELLADVNRSSAKQAQHDRHIVILSRLKDSSSQEPFDLTLKCIVKLHAALLQSLGQENRIYSLLRKLHASGYSFSDTRLYGLAENIMYDLGVE